MDRLEIAALKLAIDDQPWGDLPSIAADALAEGSDSPHLRRAAGVSEDDPWLARDTFVWAIEELGYCLPPEQEALALLTRRIAEGIVEGSVPPHEGARSIWRWSHRLELEGDLRIFVGLASEWDDHPSIRDSLDQHIVRAAVDLLGRRRLRRWVKVMAEYECWPLWIPVPPRNLDPRELPISDVLDDDLATWARDFDMTYVRDDPVSSGFATVALAESFVARGAALVDRLQAELGDEWHVEYRPAPTRPLR